MRLSAITLIAAGALLLSGCGQKVDAQAELTAKNIKQLQIDLAKQKSEIVGLKKTVSQLTKSVERAETKQEGTTTELKKSVALIGEAVRIATEQQKNGESTQNGLQEREFALQEALEIATAEKARFSAQVALLARLDPVQSRLTIEALNVARAGKALNRQQAALLRRFPDPNAIAAAERFDEEQSAEALSAAKAGELLDRQQAIQLRALSNPDARAAVRRFDEESLRGRGGVFEEYVAEARRRIDKAVAEINRLKSQTEKVN